MEEDSESDLSIDLLGGGPFLRHSAAFIQRFMVVQIDYRKCCFTLCSMSNVSKKLGLLYIKKESLFCSCSLKGRSANSACGDQLTHGEED